MKRFNVVIAKEDGGVEIYPMKEWLRQHPEYMPPGLSPDPSNSTSHQLRSGLRKQGWDVSETPSEVRLVKPGAGNLSTNIDAVIGDGEGEDGADEAEASFALEYQLRDFLALNFNAIPVEGKKLRLYVDPTGRDGVEYPTAVGPIDVLAVDEAGAFVVFELKRARSPDHAIGQLSRYMGWVKQTIGKNQVVRGVVVAKVISDKLRYAASVIPNVSLFEYEVSFKLKPANEQPSDLQAATNSSGS